MAMQPKTPNSFLFFLSVDIVALPSLLVVNFLCKGVFDLTSIAWDQSAMSYFRFLYPKQDSSNEKMFSFPFFCS